jgi:4,4'-diaponeurosporenoate glycosyltransferase
MTAAGYLSLFRAAVAAAGFYIFNARMLTSLRPRPSAPRVSGKQLGVSLIIPARNEAGNLPALLRSIRALDPAPGEVIVVDDHSTDGTALIAAQFGARVIAAPPLPKGWLGKPWACTAGAAAASCPLLLFTDADTVHAPDSLGRAVAALEAENAALVSILPEHIAVALWEKLQGIFQLLLLVATRAGASGAHGERCFCIGQYLLIRRSSYERIGGHFALRNRVAEDLGMARLVEQQGLRFCLLRRPGALRVRMYPDGLTAFVKGWRRSFREGMQAAGASGACETALVVAWLLDVPRWLVEVLSAAHYRESAVALCALFVSCLNIAYWQRHVGAFKARSALAYPVFALLFVWVTGLALFDAILRRPVAWKGRSIPADDLGVAKRSARSA